MFAFMCCLRFRILNQIFLFCASQDFVLCEKHYFTLENSFWIFVVWKYFLYQNHHINIDILFEKNVRVYIFCEIFCFELIIFFQFIVHRHFRDQYQRFPIDVSQDVGSYIKPYLKYKILFELRHFFVWRCSS